MSSLDGDVESVHSEAADVEVGDTEPDSEVDAGMESNGEDGDDRYTPFCSSKFLISTKFAVIVRFIRTSFLEESPPRKLNTR
jgi:hypothetical protein